MKPVRFNLHYSEHEYAIIQKKATNNNFGNVNRFITFRLMRELDKVRPCANCTPGKRKRAYVRITNADVIDKLSQLANLSGIPASVLIKRLTTDPIVIQAQMEVAPDSLQIEPPESPSPGH